MEILLYIKIHTYINIFLQVESNNKKEAIFSSLKKTLKVSLILYTILNNFSLNFELLIVWTLTLCIPMSSIIDTKTSLCVRESESTRASIWKVIRDCGEWGHFYFGLQFSSIFVNFRQFLAVKKVINPILLREHKKVYTLLKS